MARIGKGEDFIRLIRENSDSPTAAQDGDLGFIQRGQAIPEIEEAAKDLKPVNMRAREGNGRLLHHPRR